MRYCKYLQKNKRTTNRATKNKYKFDRSYPYTYNWFKFELKRINKQKKSNSHLIYRSMYFHQVTSLTKDISASAFRSKIVNDPNYYLKTNGKSNPAKFYWRLAIKKSKKNDRLDYKKNRIIHTERWYLRNEEIEKELFYNLNKR